MTQPSAPQGNPGDIINWPMLKIVYRTDKDKLEALLPPGIEPGVSYRVGQLPPAFQRVHVKGNDLAFYHAGSGSIAVHATCNGYEDVPNGVLRYHLLFGTTQRV